MEANPSDAAGVKPWTIRGVPPEERNAAIAAAERSDMNVGDWLRRAIRSQIQAESQASRAPVPVGQSPSDGRTALSDVERIAATMRDLAAAGVPVPPKHAARVTSALVAQLPGRVRRNGASGPTGQAKVSDAPALPE